MAVNKEAGQLPAKAETLRRLRLGDLSRLYRARYGPILPDDDAGRADLHDLLCLISTGANAEIKMPRAVELWAPWMSLDEVEAAIDYINRMPLQGRRLNPVELGRRHMVTNEQREALGLRQIAPIDMTAAQMKARRKARDKARQLARRRKAGIRPRAKYVAKSISKTKPWLAAGISRRTWYRQMAQVRSRVTRAVA